MITLVPVSHVSGKSRVTPVKAILSLKPEIVAVELCRKRLQALQTRESREPKLDLNYPKESAIALALFKIQEFYGKQTGEKPGYEFLEAMEAARKVNAEVALIDRSIYVTMERLSSALTFNDVLRIIAMTIDGDTVMFDLNSVPGQKIVGELLKEFEKRFPKLYDALVGERDEYMARQLRKFEDRNVVVIVGAGHIAGLKKRLDAKVYR